MEHTKNSAVGDVVLRLDLTREMREHMRSTGVPDAMDPGLQCATLGRCTIIAAREGEQLRWHLSISHPFRPPTWDEINAARDALIPADVWLCQPMPPKAFWINIHPTCFHLWEIRDHALIAQWAFDGCGDNERADAVADAACGIVP